MRGQPGLVRMALVFAALLAGLSMVVWRQSRALETLRIVDRVRHERAVAESERREVLRRIQVLESRTHVVGVARDRLGMHVPTGVELVILSLDDSDKLVDDGGEDAGPGGVRGWPMMVRRWISPDEGAPRVQHAVAVTEELGPRGAPGEGEADVPPEAEGGAR